MTSTFGVHLRIARPKASRLLSATPASAYQFGIKEDRKADYPKGSLRRRGDKPKTGEITDSAPRLFEQRGRTSPAAPED
jgi:hypothetical protein